MQSAVQVHSAVLEENLYQWVPDAIKMAVVDLQRGPGRGHKSIYQSTTYTICNDKLLIHEVPMTAVPSEYYIINQYAVFP